MIVNVRGGAFHKQISHCQHIKIGISLNKDLNGSTKKQQNPHNEESLAWATWIIAKLRGWKEFYNKKRPPGNKTLVWGLQKFDAIMVGFNIAKMNNIKLKDVS